jgi:hypothetical protein
MEQAMFRPRVQSSRPLQMRRFTRGSRQSRAMARFLCADSRVDYDKFTDRTVGFVKTGAFSRAMTVR